ncbi:multidrug effflux MFS transporter [Labrys neptuniae]|uniref:Bcr/CflA family efflux transporter n=1 Tax=Labrys neptuniae TaxID=376174 RepID=A0ABV3PID9_9HYPH|nr:multidrug effflux MFS transporter [Labrys neptuniae]MDT3382553.1 multidrug effflux MFS transporter [Labrys neptuniae]
MTDTTSHSPVVGKLGRTEFIVLVASLVAVNAFAIDIMLPGLQQIGASLGEPDPNRRQLVIPAYLLGFGLLQLVFGPLSDRFGRRGPLLVGLGIYCLAALCAFFTTDFNALVALRLVQGGGAAASAVIATALVRDVFAGNQMARIMSLVFTVLMLSPILAPSLGQGLMTVMDWRGLFGFMAGWGAIVIGWVWWRLPETLQPEHKRPLSLKAVIEGFGIVFANRVSLAYIIGMAALFGALMGFLNSSQQIYRDVFGVETMFPLFFAGGAACSALGGMVNAQLVNRYGMRLLSWLALGVFGAAALAILVAALLQALPLWLFFGLSAAQFLVFSMILSNYGALAMEPLGEVAGTAASTQGFLQMVPGAAIGILIGQVFNGTVIPLAIGYVAMVALTAVCVTLMAGRGRVTG